MTVPLGLLAIPSMFIGYLTKDLFIGLGSDFWGNAIFINPANFQLIDAEFLPFLPKILPLLLRLLSIFT